MYLIYSIYYKSILASLTTRCLFGLTVSTLTLKPVVVSSSPASDHRARLFFPSGSFYGLFPIVLSTILHCKFEFHRHPRTVE